jgi:hypothetical protein
MFSLFFLGAREPCISTAADLLNVDRYKDFLAERRKAISGRLNEFLGTMTP